MKIIDSHQHFWHYNPKKHTWIDESMSILQQDFEPKDLFPVYKKNKIDGCIAVQADTTIEETSFLLSIAEEHDFVWGVVGWVDFCDSNIEKTLEQFSDKNSLKGYRHIVQDEPNGFLDRSDFRAGIKKLASYHYSYDVLIYPHQLEEAIRFVKAFPNQHFILDHLAKPYIKNKKIDLWQEHITQLAAFDNLSCKVSGMVTEANWDNWKFTDLVPYLDVITNTFGTNRLLFGSDWPVCLLGGSYEEILQIVTTYCEPFSQDEKEAIFYKNAQAIYQIDEQ